MFLPVNRFETNKGKKMELGALPHICLKLTIEIFLYCFYLLIFKYFMWDIPLKYTLPCGLARQIEFWEFIDIASKLVLIFYCIATHIVWVVGWILWLDNHFSSTWINTGAGAELGNKCPIFVFLNKTSKSKIYPRSLKVIHT